MTNLARNLIATAVRAPEKTALKLDAVEVSYAALDAASTRVAGLVRSRGVQPGDRVRGLDISARELEEVTYEHPAEVRGD